MAVSANSYFSNAIIGDPQVGSDINIYDTSTTPKYSIGYGFSRADGNRYRYCHFGALSAVGAVVSTDHIESSMTSTQLFVGAEPGNVTRKSGYTLDPNVVGARYMQLTITATADQFAGGYIGSIAGSGTGYTYRILGNTATGTPVTGDCYLSLSDPIQQSIGSNTSFLITGSKFANLEPANAATQAICTPVGFATVGQSAANYGWVCTKGITTAVLGTPVGSQGALAIVSTNTAGSIVSLPITSGGNYAIVGVVVQTYSASTYCLVDATLE
jgi:hypothetical protein